MNKLFLYFFSFLLIIQLLISCRSTQAIINPINGISCLVIDNSNLYNSNFNPAWISTHQINKVVSTTFYNKNFIYNNIENLERKRGFNVFEFYENGYLKSSSGTDGNPNRKKEKNTIVKHEYSYEEKDSFLIRDYKQIRFRDKNGKRTKPDTLKVFDFTTSINHTSASYYHHDKKTVAKKYSYDKKQRLIEVRDGLNELKLKYIYHSDNEIELIKYSNWHKNPTNSNLIKINDLGQIIESVNKVEDYTFLFEYDKNGALINRSEYRGGRLLRIEKFKYYLS